MPGFNSSILPSTGGLSLGAPLQRWDADLANVSINDLRLSPITGVSITPSGAIYVSATSITANANTTGIQQLMSFTVPGGILNANGKVLRLRMGGSYTTQIGQTPNLSIIVNLAGILLTAPFGGLTSAASNYRWSASAEFIVAQAGVSGLFEPLSLMDWGPPSGPQQLADGSALSRVGPVDLTSDALLTVNCQFTTNTSPANVVVQRSLIAEVLN